MKKVLPWALVGGGAVALYYALRPSKASAASTTSEQKKDVAPTPPPVEVKDSLVKTVVTKATDTMPSYEIKAFEAGPRARILVGLAGVGVRQAPGYLASPTMNGPVDLASRSDESAYKYALAWVKTQLRGEGFYWAGPTEPKGQPKFVLINKTAATSPLVGGPSIQLRAMSDLKDVAEWCKGGEWVVLLSPDNLPKLEGLETPDQMLEMLGMSPTVAGYRAAFVATSPGKNDYPQLARYINAPLTPDEKYIAAAIETVDASMKPTSYNKVIASLSVVESIPDLGVKGRIVDYFADYDPKKSEQYVALMKLPPIGSELFVPYHMIRYRGAVPYNLSMEGQTLPRGNYSQLRKSSAYEDKYVDFYLANGTIAMNRSAPMAPAIGHAYCVGKVKNAMMVGLNPDPANDSLDVIITKVQPTAPKGTAHADLDLPRPGEFVRIPLNAVDRVSSGLDSQGDPAGPYVSPTGG